MTVDAASPLQSFVWKPQPQAAKFIGSLVDSFLKNCPAAANLAQRMREETGTRFMDWIGHVALPRKDARVARINAVGYTAQDDLKTITVFEQENGIFPTVLVWDGLFEIAIKVESVADYLAANSLEIPITGQPLAQVRSAKICECGGNVLSIIERHGSRAFAPPGAAPENAMRRLTHLEKFRMRRRDFETDEQGFDHANELIDAAIADLGVDLTCDIWFAAEREYWQRRNHAAQVQYSRQNQLGLGWANHDHHTYRSSGQNFTRLVATWEKLGFHCRERFYAGREAGWGAQVMEQPVTGITTFNDVDLSPDELLNDFAHEPLPQRDRLGTVGLWCGLHGESFLQAGMHHLEAQFDFDSLRKQLSGAEVKTMKPFTDLPYLRQAFTEGERWAVRPERIESLLRAALITETQARKFRDEGAIGSHLENLERNDGFKGFNQTGVSEIIAATDPRKHVTAGA